MKSNQLLPTSDSILFIANVKNYSTYFLLSSPVSTVSFCVTIIARLFVNFLSFISSPTREINL